MNINVVLSAINKVLIKKYNHKMTKQNLKTITFDMTRYLDKDINGATHVLAKHLGITFNYASKNKLRNYFLGYPQKKAPVVKDLDKLQIIPSFLVNQKLAKYIDFEFKYHREAFIKDVVSRYKAKFLYQSNDMNTKYIHYLHQLQQGKYQLLYLDVDNKLSESSITKFIKNTYSKLSNYHYCVINFSANKYHQINWELIARVAIFMENFKLEKHFHAFNSRNQKKEIKLLTKFLNDNLYINTSNQKLVQKLVKKFYSGVSYGYRFIDLLIGSDMSKVSLVMQKIQLDETPKRCPICFHKSTKGNSYPYVLFKSFECNNPSCPARSKSGRGKRYDLLSAKRQAMVKRNDANDIINDHLIKDFHRDIVNPKSLNLTNFISLDTWSGDSVLAVNLQSSLSTYRGRDIKYAHILNTNHKLNDFYKLPIVRLLKAINKLVIIPKQTKVCPHQYINQSTLMLNDNSNNLIQDKNRYNLQIGSAITSPPYYNARQYSQWPNFICYLIDMLVNAKVVNQVLDNHSVYIYNVGDIVGQNNDYVLSRMSITRIMLGFYSALIMRIANFNLVSDFIWDKGEVQSHRNSTNNHYPGYIKPVNCYEHCLVLVKGKYIGNLDKIKNKIVSISPVIKINSHGKNTYGHTAPFPFELVHLILPFTNHNTSILDPFVGSGTTCSVALTNKYKSVGVELSPKYYKLAIHKIKHNSICDKL